MPLSDVIKDEFGVDKVVFHGLAIGGFKTPSASLQSDSTTYDIILEASIFTSRYNAQVLRTLLINQRKDKNMHNY
jgi:hypothetical protein